MGVIVREEYVCDYCSRPITDADMMVGRLTLRKRGARGLGREVALALHPSCAVKLAQNATGTSGRRRSPTKRPGEPDAEPEALTEAKPKAKSTAARRRRKSSAEARA